METTSPFTKASDATTSPDTITAPLERQPSPINLPSPVNNNPSPPPPPPPPPPPSPPPPPPSIAWQRCLSTSPAHSATGANVPSRQSYTVLVQGGEPQPGDAALSHHARPACTVAKTEGTSRSV